MAPAVGTGRQRPIFVGIGGDSGSGKSTLTAGFYRIFPASRITSLCLDDYHSLDRRERGLVGITALDPRASNFALMENQLLALKRGQSILKPVYDHRDGTFGGHRSGSASVPRPGNQGPLRFEGLARPARGAQAALEGAA